MTRPTLTSPAALRTALAAAVLACAGLPALAADFIFSGVTDSGPLSGMPFSGSASFADPAPGFDGSIDLSAFSLQFAGQGYTLAGADAGTVPVVWFSAGSLIGIDYQDSSAADLAARPYVYLTAGFTDLSEAFFAYDSLGNGIQGYGSISAVPEPTSWALMLAGLLATGALARRR